MKSFIRLTTIVKYVLINILLIPLMCIQLSAQSSEHSGVNTKGWKSELSDDTENYVPDKDQKESELVDSDVTIVSSDFSTEKKPIEVTVIAGQYKTQILMIQNSGDSPIRWNIAPEGSEKLLYRLFVEDRDLLEISDADGKSIHDVLSYVDFDGSPTTIELDNNKVLNPTSRISSMMENPYNQAQTTNPTIFTNTLDDSHSSKFSDNEEPQQQLEISPQKMDADSRIFLETQDNNRSSEFSDNVKSSYREEIQQVITETDSFNDPMQTFRKWYQFEECGYPIFKPQMDVWEISQDNGDHWQQILSINGQPYIVNAHCFNPVELLERQYLDDQMSLSTELTTLQEFVRQVQRGPVLSPNSGIIPAGTIAEIEVSVDATSLEGGTYEPHLVLTDGGSLETVVVVPLHLTVVPELEKVPPPQLSKQSLGNQIPDKFGLSQNYPNPFNPSTTIKYSIPKVSFVSLKVYNIVGEEVSVLVSEQINAGFYEIEFDAANLPSGVYFYRLQAGSFVETKKMVLMK